MSATVWKTGRSYSANGQRMAAQHIHGGRIVFVDVDRGIDGVIDVVSDGCIKNDVMYSYDRGIYKPCDRHNDLSVVVAQLTKLAKALE